ncbi:MAG: hypothetical protein RQ751_05745 [Longimicrobiales bacterium]|nr:hypothetical protein [Longimicrobiales bacterium]
MSQRRRDPHTPARRAGPWMILLFLLLPPVGGSVLAASLLTGAGRVPWVLLGAFFTGVGAFLVASPLAERSDGFRVARYRRLSEAAVLVGLTAGAVVVYTLVVHLLLGVRRAWPLELLRGLAGG